MEKTQEYKTMKDFEKVHNKTLSFLFQELEAILNEKVF